MPNRLTTLALAAATLATVAPAPSHAAILTTGRFCSMTQSYDPTGLISQDPNYRFGEVDAGPYLIATDAGPASPITLICLVQVNNPTPSIATAKVAVYSAPGMGVAVLAPTAVSFGATATDNIYLCSGTWAKLPDGTWVHTFNDDDESSAGIQCALQISASL